MQQPRNDVRLVDKKMKERENKLYVPNLFVLPQIIDLLNRFALQLCAILTPRLELVYELVRHIPEPGGWEIVINHPVLQKHSEEFTVALP